MKKLYVASALLLSIGSAHAADSIRWDKASVSYESIDSVGNRITGFGAAGTKLISEHLFLSGSFISTSIENKNYYYQALEQEKLSLGLGYRHMLSETTDIFGVVSYKNKALDTKYIRDEISVPYESEYRDSGYGLKAGVRLMLTDKVEFGGSIGYENTGDFAEGSIDVTATYHFTNHFSADVRIGKAGSDDTLGVAAVMYF